MSKFHLDPVDKHKILQNPKAFLEDVDILRALIDEGKTAETKNIIDLRAIFMQRLEARIDTLRNRHEAVIATAYDNVAATALVHRAIVHLMTPKRFDTFLEYLNTDWANNLGVQAAHLCIEIDNTEAEYDFGKNVVLLDRGTINAYCADNQFRNAASVILRAKPKGGQDIYGDMAEQIETEAVLRLTIGANRPSAFVVLGSTNSQYFMPDMATDLLEFYTTVFGHVLQGWLQ